MDNVNNPNVDNDHQLNEELTTLARDVGAVNLADDPAAQNIEAAARDEALDQIMMSKRQLEASFEMAQLATGYVPTENTVLSQSFSAAAGETTGTRAQALTRGFVANPVEVAQQLMVEVPENAAEQRLAEAGDANESVVASALAGDLQAMAFSVPDQQQNPTTQLDSVLDPIVDVQPTPTPTPETAETPTPEPTPTPVPTP